MSTQGKAPETIRARFEEDRSLGRVTRRVIFAATDQTERTIFWDIIGPEHALPSALSRADLAATALIFLAMREGRDLHIEGRVSEKLLQNLEDFQARWSMWRPDAYKVIKLSADAEITEPHSRPERHHTAAVTYSGGVDSTASVFRHHAGLAGRASRRIKTAILVKGFDIPLDRQEGWQVVVDRAARTLADIDVPLCVVETNWRALVVGDWEMEHGAGVLTALRHWEEDADTLIMAADYDHKHFVIPWGSNPITNPLLEGDDTAIPFDGAQYSRTEKVELISRWPAGYDALRVCYEDDVTGTNCGVCRKCVMTKMNALACGLPVPASLHRPPTMAEVRSLSKVSLLLSQTLAAADQRGVKDPLFEALRARKAILPYLQLVDRAKRKTRHILQHGRW